MAKFFLTEENSKLQQQLLLSESFPSPLSGYKSTGKKKISYTLKKANLGTLFRQRLSGAATFSECLKKEKFAGLLQKLQEIKNKKFYKLNLRFNANLVPVYLTKATNTAATPFHLLIQYMCTQLVMHKNPTLL